MMAEMARLLPNGSATMTVGAPDLTVADFPLERRDRVLEERESHHAATLGADVVELQDDKVRLTAVEAPGTPEMVDDEEEVPSSAWVAVERRGPVGINAPGVRLERRAAAMAVCTNELAPCDLRLDASQSVALVHECGYRGGLRPYVIEFKHQRVGESAVRAVTSRQHVEHKAPCLRASALSSEPGLATVKFAALSNVVRATALAPGAIPVKLHEREPLAAGRTELRVASVARRAWVRRGFGSLGRTAAGPDAGRGKRNAQVTGDLAQRPTLLAELTSQTLLSEFRGRHTNVCSRLHQTE
jgi:hypothetical protein